MRIPAPLPDEYAPFYAGYVDAAGQADAHALLERQPQLLRAATAGLSEEEALARYAPGKWSVKEVIGHLTDSERIFACRALRISRADRTPLPGFDENAYVAAAGFDHRPLAALVADFDLARAGTLALVRGTDYDAWERRTVVGQAEVSLRAMIHIIAGHAQHHLRLLEERYGLRIPDLRR